MICKNPNCNFAWHCFVKKKENKEFVPPCASLKEREVKNVRTIIHRMEDKGYIRKSRDISGKTTTFKYIIEKWVN